MLKQANDGKYEELKQLLDNIQTQDNKLKSRKTSARLASKVILAKVNRSGSKRGLKASNTKSDAFLEINFPKKVTV